MKRTFLHISYILEPTGTHLGTHVFLEEALSETLLFANRAYSYYNTK